MKTQEVRELTDKELVERIGTERANLSKMKLNHAISPIDNPCQIREARKTVARLLISGKRNTLSMASLSARQRSITHTMKKTSAISAIL